MRAGQVDQELRKQAKFSGMPTEDEMVKIRTELIDLPICEENRFSKMRKTVLLGFAALAPLRVKPLTNLKVSALKLATRRWLRVDVMSPLSNNRRSRLSQERHCPRCCGNAQPNLGRYASQTCILVLQYCFVNANFR